LGLAKGRGGHSEVEQREGKGRSSPEMSNCGEFRGGRSSGRRGKIPKLELDIPKWSSARGVRLARRGAGLFIGSVGRFGRNIAGGDIFRSLPKCRPAVKAVAAGSDVGKGLDGVRVRCGELRSCPELRHGDVGRGVRVRSFGGVANRT
jgi:hypothetical protein